MTFQHELWRGGSEFPVIVRARAFRTRGTEGTLGDPPGWRFEQISVKNLAGEEIETTREEDDVIEQVGLSMAERS